MTRLAAALVALSLCTLQAADAPPGKPRVAVADFAVKGTLGQKDAGEMVACMVLTGLGGDRYEPVERAQLKAMLAEQRFQMSELAASEAKAADFGKICGVRFLVLGEVMGFGEKVVVTLRVVDCETGRLTGEKATETVGRFADLPDRMEPLLAKAGLSGAPVASPGAADTPAGWPPKSWTSPLGMDFALVPAGRFEMGAGASDLPPEADAQPRHSVRIMRPFLLGRFEVTVSQFRAFVDASGYRTEAETGGGAFIWTGKKFELRPDANWKNPGLPQGADSPAVCLTWNDAKAFCRWLNASEPTRPAGWNYRLPTEAEWEYACRAGTETRYHTGDGPEALIRAGWFFDNGGQTTHAVGQKQPNAWGFCDMHGNAWEWCEDAYDPAFYAQAPADNPCSAAGGENRVLRGGGWSSSGKICHASHRDKDLPGSSHCSYGMRVVLAPGP